MTRLILGLGLAFLVAAPALAQPRTPQPQPAVTQPLDRTIRADGASVVPDHFLRRWDPVTVLFDSDQGPAQGGPEDAPERLVQMTPAIPGAWQWLGARALQFRPTEAWQPLRRVEITAAGRTTRLVPLLPAPVRTIPAADSEGVADLDTITLTFADPVDPAALARLLTIELRPAPGTATPGAALLTSQDFTIRPMERDARDAPANYLVVLRRPLPDGYVAVLRLALSDEPGLDDQAFELRLRSAPPFALTDTSCARGYDRDTQDGLLRCSPLDRVATGRRRSTRCGRGRCCASRRRSTTSPSPPTGGAGR
jgi:hypothetical protein